MRATARVRALAALCGLLAPLLMPVAAARGGTIAVASCRTPAGAPAPIEGWEEGWTLNPMPFAGDANECADGGPLSSVVYDNEPQPGSAGPIWRYTPPAGYVLTGGEVDAGFSVPGGGENFTGAAGLLGPKLNFDSADVIAGPVGGTPASSEGDYSLAGHTGGQLWIYAFCEPPGGTCPAHDSFESYWALAEVRAAILELTDTTTPQASGFGGSLLEAGAHGTAQLTFTASEAAPGPGIYAVDVSIDGHVVYDGTPDGNSGRCASVGRDTNGVLEFLSAAPCPLSEQVDIPVETTGLADGGHELRVTVTDAASVSETVYAGQITTVNRTAVSSLPDSRSSGAVAGEPPRYEIRLAKATARMTAGVRRSYERSALRVSGTLENSAGAPAPGVSMELSEYLGTEHARHQHVLARAITNATGQWRLRAAKGPSRQLRVGYGPGDGEAITISETVRPSLSLDVASPGGGRIVFSGKLAIAPLGSPHPLVTVQTHAPDGWETVGIPVHVRASGSYRYVFQSSPVTVGRRFAFRAKTPRSRLWSAASSDVVQAVVR